jgi:hypothetical protein
VGTTGGLVKRRIDEARVGRHRELPMPSMIVIALVDGRAQGSSSAFSWFES